MQLTLEELKRDIPLSTAVAAHSGTSMSPERRGDSEQSGYATEMLNHWEQLSAMCRNDSERATLVEWFPRFRAVMRRATLDYLHSESRCVSWFIAGPSNFPARRMEKRNRWAHNKLNHLLEIKARMLKRIKRDLRPEARPIMAGDSDACARLQEKIAHAERLQGIMRECNGIIRRERKNGEPAQVAALVAYFASASIFQASPESKARELLKPDFCGRIGFADYELTNNSANIRRMKQRLEGISRNQNTEASEVEGTNARAEDCPAENRIRLFFPGKPAADVRDRLKHGGFRWSPTLGCWQAYRNTGTIILAMKEAGLAELGGYKIEAPAPQTATPEPVTA